MPSIAAQGTGASETTMLIDRVTRAPEVRDLVSLALVEALGARSPDEGLVALDEEIEATVARMRELFGGRSAGKIETLQPARTLYRAAGIDPTRHRPSPEALLRRLLRGESFPRILPPVDLANLWAVTSGLPVGLYDADRIAGPVVLRRGLEGESYVGINKPEVHLAGRLTLSDDEGPFGNPTSDSLRASVGERSTHLLFVMFAPSDHDLGLLDCWAAWLRERAGAMLGASTVSGVLA